MDGSLPRHVLNQRGPLETAGGTQRPCHALPAADVLEVAGVAVARGLSHAEVRVRRQRFGPNRLRSVKRRSAWRILVDQFASLIVALLAGAATLSFLFGRWAESLAIGAVLLLNGAIGFVMELRAIRSMEALRKLGSVRARVRRDGSVHDVAAEELVPGDIIVLEAGDVVTADLRTLEASRLEADESMLTGESMPVGKTTDPVEEGAPLAEQTSMLFKGTAITRGAGEGVVVGTGMQTELGRISRLVEEAEPEATPLEKRLDRLGQRLIGVTLLVAVGIATTGLLAGKDWLLIVETAIALAVATVPEGLPIIATIALARGMRSMARRNALVNGLSAVETLGATAIIFTDKTGTLTENRMVVSEVALWHELVELRRTGGAIGAVDGGAGAAQQTPLRRALAIGVLCNDASLGDTAPPVGDPLEVALLVAGRAAGLERARLLQDTPEEREVAFDPSIKMMATVHREGAAHRIAVKGAPEVVLAAATRQATPDGEPLLGEQDRSRWLERNAEMAGRGLRVLALATRVADTAEADCYRDLVFVALVGLLDPPREDAAPAIAACRKAGIRVVMVTGDQPATARAIARRIGLVEDEHADVVLGRELEELASGLDASSERLLAARIFARIEPKQKLDLIAWHQQRGLTVAMTGDGVNDAPALRKADIGVAMGRRGTEVARQAADIVLQDDAFATIVSAVRHGRTIFGNIRRSVLYLLSCNISEIFVVGFAAAVAAPLPLLPLQILFLNLVTDVFPALALGVGEADPAVMERPPRPPAVGVLEAPHWWAIAGYGLLITVAVLGAMVLGLWELGMSEREAVTVSFLTLAFAQLWHVFNARSVGSGLFRNEVTANGWVWSALALCTLLLLAAVYVPALASLLEVARLGWEGWALVAGMSLLPLAVGQTLTACGIGVPAGG